MTNTTEELKLWKLTLLAEWQYLCHDSFDEEEDMNEDQYWQYLQEKTPEQVKQMIYEDYDGQDFRNVLDMYMSYMGGPFQDAAAQLLEEES